MNISNIINGAPKIKNLSDLFSNEGKCFPGHFFYIIELVLVGVDTGSVYLHYINQSYIIVYFFIQLQLLHFFIVKL